MEGAGADEYSIGQAAQESHHEPVFGAASAYLSSARPARNAERYHPVDRLHEVADDVRPSALGLRKGEIASIEPLKFRPEDLRCCSLPFV